MFSNQDFIINLILSKLILPTVWLVALNYFVKKGWHKKLAICLYFYWSDASNRVVVIINQHTLYLKELKFAYQNILHLIKLTLIINPSSS
jgi:hypothetical protein